MLKPQNKAVEAKQRLQKIQNMKISHHIKLMLLESFIAELKNQVKAQNQNIVLKQNDKSMISDTFFTDSPSLCALRDLQDLQMESKILTRRQVKIQLNEEIQLLEDDLFQQDKIVQTKRQLNQELDKQINKLHHQINIEAYKNSVYSPRGDTKKIMRKTNSVSSLFKKIFA